MGFKKRRKYKKYCNKGCSTHQHYKHYYHHHHISKHHHHCEDSSSSSSSSSCSSMGSYGKGYDGGGYYGY